MVAPVKLNFKIYQGSTFKETLRWETSTKVYKPITSITKSAPMVISAPAHGIPIGWRAKITNVLGMKEINSNDIYHTVTGTSTDSITLNAVNSLGYTDYTSGGVIEYNEPPDLASMTGRMQLRAKIDSVDTIFELTTENGGILIDNALKTISINIGATTSAGFTFSQAVYSLELIKGQEVTPFIYGSISLEKEITR
jgi:hypothetical protein